MLKPIFVLLSALSLAAATNAAASDVPPSSLWGKPGGVYFRHPCPPGWYLTGFAGNVGAWIDRLKMVCAPWLLDEGRLGPPKVIEDYAIGWSGGGRPRQPEICPDQYLMTGATYVFSRLNDNTGVLHSIEFGCQKFHSVRRGDWVSVAPKRFGSESSIDTGGGLFGLRVRNRKAGQCPVIPAVGSSDSGGFR
jgi:hypothetical protein